MRIRPCRRPITRTHQRRRHPRAGPSTTQPNAVECDARAARGPNGLRSAARLKNSATGERSEPVALLGSPRLQHRLVTRRMRGYVEATDETNSDAPHDGHAPEAVISSVRASPLAIAWGGSSQSPQFGQAIAHSRRRFRSQRHSPAKRVAANATPIPNAIQGLSVGEKDISP